MWLTDSYASEHCGDRWIIRSRSGVEIARTERVDERWETTGPMIHAHEHRFVGGAAEETIVLYPAWGGYLTSCTGPQPGRGWIRERIRRDTGER